MKPTNPDRKEETMQTYVGYGFDTDLIEEDFWVNLVKKYDSNAYRKICKNTHDPDKIIKETMDFIDENHINPTDYLVNIINSTESETAGTDYIVSAYDRFLVFDSIRFADDSKRSKYIRTQDDFIRMISKYVPITDITFGNVYEGNEWLDPSFFMD